MQIKLRKAVLSDVDDISNLLENEVQKGVILRRDKSEISQNIRSYILASSIQDSKDKIVGLSALHIHTQGLGEIRSLMVASDFRSNGIGQKIITSLLQEAKDIGVQKVLVLTFRAKLFEMLGFIQTNKENMPNQKIWQDCINCKFFPKCEEILLIKTI